MSHAPASAVDGIWIAAHHEEDTVRCRSNVHISWARPLLGFFEQGHFVRQLRASDLHHRHSPKLECGPPCLSLNVLVLVQVVVAMAWVHKAAARAGSVYGRLPQTSLLAPGNESSEPFLEKPPLFPNEVELFATPIHSKVTPLAGYTAPVVVNENEGHRWSNSRGDFSKKATESLTTYAPH